MHQDQNTAPAETGESVERIDARNVTGPIDLGRVSVGNPPAAPDSSPDLHGLTPLDRADVPEAIRFSYHDGTVFATHDRSIYLVHWARSPSDEIPWRVLNDDGIWSVTPEAALEAAGLDPALLDQMRRPAPPEGWQPGWMRPAPPNCPSECDVRRIVKQLKAEIDTARAHGTVDARAVLHRDALDYIEALSARVAQLESEPWGGHGPGVVQSYTNAPDWLEATMLGAPTAELNDRGCEAPHRSLRRLAINMTSEKTWVHPAIIPTILETLADRVEALAPPDEPLDHETYLNGMTDAGPAALRQLAEDVRDPIYRFAHDAIPAILDRLADEIETDGVLPKEPRELHALLDSVPSEEVLIRQLGRWISNKASRSTIIDCVDQHTIIRFLKAPNVRLESEELRRSEKKPPEPATPVPAPSIRAVGPGWIIDADGHLFPITKRAAIKYRDETPRLSLVTDDGTIERPRSRHPNGCFAEHDAELTAAIVDAINWPKAGGASR